MLGENEEAQAPHETTVVCSDAASRPHVWRHVPTLGSAVWLSMGLPVATTGGALEIKPGESPFVKMVIGALCAWSFELSIGHYIEVLKIAKQTSDMSYAQITRDMIRSKGFVGILDGFFPWGSLQAVFKGASFGVGHAQGKRMMVNCGLNETSPRLAEVLSGGIGGAVQGAVLNPVLLLKTRVITDPTYRNAGGLVATASRSSKIGFAVIENEGLVALMKGAEVLIPRRFLDWTTRFIFVDQVEQLFKGFDSSVTLSVPVKYLASFSGGVLSAMATMPMDVLVSAKQSASVAGQKVSAVKILKDKYKNGGLAAIGGFSSRGFVARSAHVGLTTLLMKNFTSEVYNLYMKLSL